MDLPEFYDDIELSFDQAWSILLDGAVNRQSPAHTPVVATNGSQGNPMQRVMILREADRPRRYLRFHTDIRSPKVQEIADSARISVLVYDPAAKLQLRFSGVARVENASQTCDSAWEKSTLFARRCYMAENPPGQVSDGPASGLPEWVEGRKPTESEIADARGNFAILSCTVDGIDWLYLANSGHRRAKWLWNDSSQSWSANWLVP